MKPFLFFILKNVNFQQISIGNGFEQFNNGTKQKPMSFADLNMDIHYLILEHLDIADLMSFAGTNEYFSALAANVFQRKYSQKIVEVYPLLVQEGHDFRETGDRLYIQHSHVFPQFLKHFGQWIHRMKVNYLESGGADDILKNTSGLINLYCSNSLIEIMIFDRQQSFVSQITKPFKHVEYVEVVGDFENLNSSTLSFGEIFPAMKILSMPGTQIDNANSIYQHFSNLIELNVNFYDAYRHGRTQRKFEEDEIEQVLKKNPQIRSLKMHGPTGYILKAASEFLPDLEHIRIEPAWIPFEINSSVPKMIFKNVKTLEIEILSYKKHIQRFPESVEFESLEELRATLSPSSDFDWWIDFITKNEHLKRFYSTGGCVNNDVLEKWTWSASLSMDEISFVFCRNVEDNSLVEFVKRNPKVGKFSFKREYNGDTTIQAKTQALEKVFGHIRTITSTGDEIQLF